MRKYLVRELKEMNKRERLELYKKMIAEEARAEGQDEIRLDNIRILEIIMLKDSGTYDYSPLKEISELRDGNIVTEAKCSINNLNTNLKELNKLGFNVSALGLAGSCSYVAELCLREGD